MNTSQPSSIERTPLWASPGLIVVALFSLLAIMIAIGVIATNRTTNPIETVTIADLRADPDRYDLRTVTIRGNATSVRQLPVLDQYALYTFYDDTGEMWVLSQRGVPPGGSMQMGTQVELTAVFHSRITLDEQIETLVEAQLGSLAASVIGSILPGVGVNAVFLEHESYEIVGE